MPTKQNNKPEPAPKLPKEHPVFIEKAVTDEKHAARKQKKKKEEKPVDVLRSIYEEGGKMPDLTRLERRRRSPRAILVGLIAFFAVLAAVAWAGFFIFKPYARFEGKALELTVSGPTPVKAGEVVRYEFEYHNKERVGIAAFELRLVIPKEFKVLETSEPPTTEGAIWALGSLGARSKGVITVRGYFLGPGVGTTAFQSIATYRPANFNADFQAITTRQITLAGTVLEGTVEGAPEAAPGEELTYTYTAKHLGSEPLEGLELALEAPETFLFASSLPAPAREGEPRWRVERFEPGSELKFEIRGSFAAAAEGPTEVGVSIGTRQNDERLIHRRDVFTTDVLRSDLSLELVVNGSTEGRTANFGDRLHLTLAYKNLGESTLGDLRLSVTVASDPAGLIHDEGVEISVPARTSRGTYTWTSRELAELASLRGDALGTIDLTVPIVARPPEAAGLDEIRLAATALISTVGGRVVARQIQTAPITVTLNSDLEFTAEARYFDPDGVPLGSGPLPPKVGETTNFRIVWTLTNSRHELSEVRVRTTLPSRIGWTGRARADQGSLGWDPNSRTVLLTLDRFLGTMRTITADFEVSLTPTSSDLGRFVTLTNESTLSARDAKTGATISRAVDPLTTEMPTDEEARGRGVVTEGSQL